MTPRGTLMPRSRIAFIAGFAAALAAGWLVFPRILYTRQAQPFQFRHQTHAAKSGTAQCTDCHVLRADGEFAGIPDLEGCAACHSEPMGTSKDEATLVNGFVKPHRQAPWLVYARQPANVRFSHAIHIRRAGLDCRQCHGSQGDSDVMRPYQGDRISGYSRDTAGMAACEDCHRRRGLEVGCLGCHQ